jgi:hypothetical protein
VKAQSKIAQLEGGFTGPSSRPRTSPTASRPGDPNDGSRTVGGDVGFEGDVGAAQHGPGGVLLLNKNGTVKSYRQINADDGGFTGQLDPGDFFGQALCAMAT